MRKPLIHWLLLLLSLATLSACGFQLRGQADFDFDRIKRKGMENTEMARTMDLTLKINGLDVNHGDGPVTLNLLSDLRDRSIVTFSATGRAREMRISYTLIFNLLDANGDYLIADTALSQQRELTYDDDQILGKEAEEKRLFREMQADVAQQIITRLSNVSLTVRTQ